METKTPRLHHIVGCIALLSVMSFSPMTTANTTPSADNTPVININTATLQELTYLPGIGPATAERILHYRKTRTFARPAQVQRIKGIGPQTFRKMQPYLITEGATTATRKLPSAAVATPAR